MQKCKIAEVTSPRCTEEWTEDQPQRLKQFKT